MARTITKKVFDDDLMLSDDFDESILDKIEKRLHPDGGAEDGDRSFPELDAHDSKSAMKYSLDDFENESLPEPPFSRQKESEEQGFLSSGSSKGAAPSSVQTKPSVSRIPKLKLVMITTGCALAALGVGVIAAILLNSSKPVSQIVFLLKKTIPMAVEAEEHEFLILAEAEQEKALVTVGIEMKFYGTYDPGANARNEMAVRDAIYRFMSDQHPPKNLLEYWEMKVSNDLQAQLKASFPEMGLHSIRLTSFIRL